MSPVNAHTVIEPAVTFPCGNELGSAEFPCLEPRPA